MGEKARRRWLSRRKRKPAAREEAAPQAEPEKGEAQSDAAPSPKSPDAAPIRKGIYFSALIYVEGEQPPAENFDPVATGAVKAALASAFKEERDGLSMRVKSLEIKNDVEQDDEGEGGEAGQKEKEAEKPKEEKFQF